MEQIKRYTLIATLLWWVIQGVFLLILKNLSDMCIICGVCLIIIPFLWLYQNKKLKLAISALLTIYSFLFIIIMILLFLFTVKIKEDIPIYMLMFLISTINILISVIYMRKSCQ